MTTPQDTSTLTMEENLSKRPKTTGNETRRGGQTGGSKSNDDHDMFDDLLAAWKTANSEESRLKSLQLLMVHYGKELEWLINAGIEASLMCSTLDVKVGQLQQELKSKDDQLKALSNSKADLSKTIQNLINSQSSHQSKILEQADSITICSNLRAELHQVTSQRDEGISKLYEYKRTMELLHNEIRDLKIKLSRVSQEKMKMEREYQNTQRLYNMAMSSSKTTTSNDDHGADSTDYYKRKVSELNTRVQALQIALNEKDRQLKDLRDKEFTDRGPSGKRSL